MRKCTRRVDAYLREQFTLPEAVDLLKVVRPKTAVLATV
jgi:hypothetical protein